MKASNTQLSLEEFKEKINPEWRYNIVSKTGESLFTGIDGPSQTSKRLMSSTLAELDGDFDGAIVTVHLPNGTRVNAKGDTVQRFANRGDVIILSDDNTQEEAQPTNQPTPPKNTKPMTQLEGVMASPTTAAFFYENLKSDKEKVDKENSDLKANVKTLENEKQVHLIEKITVANKIEKLEADLEKAKDNAESVKSGVVMGLGSLLSNEKVLSRLDGIFNGPSNQLNGPMAKELQEITAWFNGNQPEGVKQAMYAAFLAIATATTDGKQFIENCKNIISLVKPTKHA
jgi:hypothetical protein